jgi:hypothetical protein
MLENMCGNGQVRIEKFTETVWMIGGSRGEIRTAKKQNGVEREVSFSQSTSLSYKSDL